MYKVFVDGAAGTTGLRIFERLQNADDITLVVLPEHQRKSLEARLAAIRAADATILCLPDNAAREIAGIAPAGAKICDASTAHRTKTGWMYGLPELGGRRRLLQGAHRIAVPGCYPTGFLSLVAPLVEKGALPQSQALVCHGLSGYSGGGKAMIAAYEGEDKPNAYNSPRLYGLNLTHKHVAEMHKISGLTNAPLFCPVVDTYYCGMLVSVPVATSWLAAPYKSGKAVAALLAEYYAEEPLVTVHPYGEATEDNTLAANAMAGKDSIELFITGNDAGVLLTARYDNLGKGASGAAVQCMNLALGREETAGLVL